MQCSLCAMILPSTSYLSHLRCDYSLHVSTIVRIVPALMSPSTRTILPYTYVFEYDYSLYSTYVFGYDSSLCVCFRVRFFIARKFPSTILPCSFHSEYGSSSHVCSKNCLLSSSQIRVFFSCLFLHCYFYSSMGFHVHKTKLEKMSIVCLVPPAVASTCSYFKKNRMVGLSFTFLSSRPEFVAVHMWHLKLIVFRQSDNFSRLPIIDIPILSGPTTV